MYWLGARKVGVTSLPPMGCLPAAITIFGEHSNECVEYINKDAITFNNMLNYTAQELQTQLSNLTLVVFDTYQPLYELVTKPGDSGNCLHSDLSLYYNIFYIRIGVVTCYNSVFHLFFLARISYNMCVCVRAIIKNMKNRVCRGKEGMLWNRIIRDIIFV